MKAEELLSQYPEAREEMNRLEVEIAAIRKKAKDEENPMYGRDDTIKVQSNRMSDTTARAGIMLADVYSSQLAEKEKELMGWKAIVDRIDRITMIAKLSYRERTYVRLRYKQGCTVSVICGKIKGRDGKKISPATADRLRVGALSKIERVM